MTHFLLPQPHHHNIPCHTTLHKKIALHSSPTSTTLFSHHTILYNYTTSFPHLNDTIPYNTPASRQCRGAVQPVTGRGRRWWRDKQHCAGALATPT